MEKFISNPVVVLFGYILGLIGTIISIVAFQKKKKYSLAFFIQDIRLLEKETKDLNHLHIQYKGETINNLTLSEIYIWNDGNQTIDKNHVAALAPLKISLDEHSKILEKTIIYVTDDYQNWRFDELASSNVIFFDYIEPQHGVKIKVIHTGIKIQLNGKLKGIKMRYKSAYPIDEKPIFHKPTFFGMLIGSLLFFSLSFIPPRSKIFVFISIIFFILAIIYFINWRRLLKISKQPSVFRDFRYRSQYSGE